MFVLKSKYRELLRERNELFDEVASLKQKNETILNFGFEKVTVCEQFKLPRLTKCQSECLLSCLYCYLNDRTINVSMTRTPKYLKQLTDKGYLRRIKRGLYKLTFVK